MTKQIPLEVWIRRIETQIENIKKTIEGIGDSNVSAARKASLLKSITARKKALEWMNTTYPPPKINVLNMQKRFGFDFYLQKY